VMELGCTAGQGFWLERPLVADDVLHLFGGTVIPLAGRRGRRAA
jgi:EAL domain-containing protein (putative c-di-GMP-specific phosphodiesterase class I)